VKWLARSVEPDGGFSWPAKFKQLRSEDFKLIPLVPGTRVTVQEESGDQLYQVLKMVDFVIRTSPW
jgi:hypothetical protein